MGTYHMPVIFVIEADSLEDAQIALAEWNDDIDLDRDVPTGTEDVDVQPNCEVNDEGQRILCLPSLDDEDTGTSADDNDDADDFNDASEGDL